MERCSLKKLNNSCCVSRQYSSSCFYLEDNEQHRLKIANRFTVSENRGDDVDNNRAWEMIRISTFQPKSSLGYYELKQYETRVKE
jgi:hypothetical protein